VSARRKRNRGKHPISRRDQPRTDQPNNPTNHGNSVSSDAAAEQESARFGLVSLAASARLTKDPQVNADEASQSRALQEFAPSHPRANEPSAAQPAGAFRAPAAAFSLTQPARAARLRKVLVVLFISLVPVGFVGLVGMKEPPLLAFRDWSGSHRNAASDSLSSQDRALHSAPLRRLAIYEARGIPGEPLPIGTSLEGVAKDAVVMITGLLPGMTLSTGSAIGANAWRVPATEFADAWIGPPIDFSGAVDVTVELHLPDQSIADRRRLRLEWAAPPVLASADPTISPEPAVPAPSAHHGAPRLVDGSANSARAALGPDTLSAPLEAGVNSVSAAADPTLVMQTPSVPPVPAQAAPAPVVASAHPPMSAPPPAPPVPPATPRTPQLDQEQVAMLVERGKHLIASGDLAAARVVLRRAAESKDAAAALALGSTYDPVILRELKTFGFAPDLEMARGWYLKAKEFGSEEAQRRIQILARSGS
jgi:hypothetical protein